MEMAHIKDLIQAIGSLKEESVNKQILEKLSDIQSQKITDRSLEIGEISSALSKAQQEMLTADMDSDNPFFKSKYADLASIVKASRPALTKYQLAVTHRIVLNSDGSQTMASLLSHSSGQWIESRMRLIPPKNDAQSMGSYISYLRRYMYACLVGVVACHEDDDGEASMEREPSKLTKPNLSKYRASEVAVECITKEQLEDLEFALKDNPELAEEVMDKLSIKSLADMPKELYRASIERIRKLVAAGSTASKRA